MKQTKGKSAKRGKLVIAANLDGMVGSTWLILSEMMGDGDQGQIATTLNQWEKEWDENGYLKMEYVRRRKKGKDKKKNNKKNKKNQKKKTEETREGKTGQ